MGTQGYIRSLHIHSKRLRYKFEMFHWFGSQFCNCTFSTPYQSLCREQLIEPTAFAGTASFWPTAGSRSRRGTGVTSAVLHKVRRNGRMFLQCPSCATCGRACTEARRRTAAASVHERGGGMGGGTLGAPRMMARTRNSALLSSSEDMSSFRASSCRVVVTLSTDSSMRHCHRPACVHATATTDSLPK